MLLTTGFDDSVHSGLPLSSTRPAPACHSTEYHVRFFERFRVSTRQPCPHAPIQQGAPQNSDCQRLHRTQDKNQTAPGTFLVFGALHWRKTHAVFRAHLFKKGGPDDD
ncbi:hypothetical protein HMPREF0291_11086 [Corynebacterium genitalium ATCC 33030]|uniref:Uncharacterized protein n=1 Tax=Corynebacterium genitalium ATCC 33030 TaxID=585529 RepID=D7WC77_9CORY|nr:hypothetical protein HMPREF0291_11086 [Corynebacterium genitalium ATCC 33030]